MKDKYTTYERVYNKNGRWINDPFHCRMKKENCENVCNGCSR
jgi:hypothetical protein